MDQVNYNKILSLFDGISCARVALKRLNVNVEYYASEIDKFAIQIALKNFPDTKQVGDVRNLKGSDFKDTFLLIGGSPCQDLSIANRNRKGLEGERSGLFWEYVRILNEIKPRYFVLENVASMPKTAKDTISSVVGIEPIMINAALVSAQSRKRLFWTNIPDVVLPEDRGIHLKDIIESGYVDRDKSICVMTGTGHATLTEYIKKSRYSSQVVFCDKGAAIRSRGLEIRSDNKSNALLSSPNSSMWAGNGVVRKLSPVECERLQSLDDGYTEGVSMTQRYKTLGNAFNVEVIKHILSFIQEFQLSNK